jgi:uncharacterized Ntn-hydrolase superfamily protein
MTFSIVARCQRTGMFGIAISSSSPAVAARCAHARAGVGAVATQNVTDPRLGIRGLELLDRDVSAREALNLLLSNDPTAAWRQLAIVDRHGGVASFTGEAALGRHAAAEGKGAVAAGNLLSNISVPARMLDAFEASDGDLGDRLVTALQAGVSSGGEEGPVHSAGLLLVREVLWPVADLRVDWDETAPVSTLQQLWERYRPQLEDYVRRALSPGDAPRFGVPGDA